MPWISRERWGYRPSVNLAGEDKLTRAVTTWRQYRPTERVNADLNPWRFGQRTGRNAAGWMSHILAALWRCAIKIRFVATQTAEWWRRRRRTERPDHGGFPDKGCGMGIGAVSLVFLVRLMAVMVRSRLLRRLAGRFHSGFCLDPKITLRDMDEHLKGVGHHGLLSPYCSPARRMDIGRYWWYCLVMLISPGLKWIKYWGAG